MDFMDKELLLDTEQARILFHGYAEDMPIIDYHCHIDPAEIYEDRSCPSMTALWLGGDHYKWRAMRQLGIPEEYITGRADDRERFRAWCRTVSYAAGSPLYAWSHLELQRYFDCRLPISEGTADEIFDLCNAKLESGELSARRIIKQSRVRVIGTTDDPCDDLRYHRLMREDKSLGCRVIPTFRPDPLLLIGGSSFPEYIARLEKAADREITDISSLKAALTDRMGYFDSLGARSSDQSTAFFPYTRLGPAELERAFEKGMRCEQLTERERLGFITELMLFLGSEYRRLGWVMQLHFGVVRNTNSRAFAALGRDSGFDRIDSSTQLETLAAFLNELDRTDSLPKTVLYCLDPSMNTPLGVLAGCFCGEGICGKVQHGAAWWFNDSIGGIDDHLRSLCEQGVLGTFIGMLTDSRCMLSYTRHEYFRRILCRYIGRLCESGELYFDRQLLGRLVQDICFNNAERFFFGALA